MSRDFCKIGLLAGLLLAGVLAAPAQERRNRIDVDAYAIDLDVSPNTQTLTAKTTVRFIPLDDNITSASFELNNGLSVSRVVDDKGRQIPTSPQTAPNCSTS